MHTSRFEQQLAGRVRIDTKTLTRRVESRRKSIERNETKRQTRREREREREKRASSRAIRHSHWLSPKSPPIRRHLSANTRNQFARAQRCFSFLFFSPRTFLPPFERPRGMSGGRRSPDGTTISRTCPWSDPPRVAAGFIDQPSASASSSFHSEQTE